MHQLDMRQVKKTAIDGHRKSNHFILGETPRKKMAKQYCNAVKSYIVRISLSNLAACRLEFLPILFLDLISAHKDKKPNLQMTYSFHLEKLKHIEANIRILLY